MHRCRLRRRCWQLTARSRGRQHDSLSQPNRGETLMCKLRGKLAAAAAFGFAATFFGTGLPACADQFYSTGKDHAQLHHVANIGNGHIEHTVVDRETHKETHYHFKGQYHW